MCDVIDVILVHDMIDDVTQFRWNSVPSGGIGVLNMTIARIHLITYILFGSVSVLKNTMVCTRLQHVGLLNALGRLLSCKG